MTDPITTIDEYEALSYQKFEGIEGIIFVNQRTVRMRKASQLMRKKIKKSIIPIPPPFRAPCTLPPPR